MNGISAGTLGPTVATGDGSVDLADWPAVLTALNAEPSPPRNPPPRLAR